ncbi:snare protein syntaxin-like protein 18/UFE1 [Tothia fuscella]|uniref:Snare protein syntaxin-like protein 18/UFE1 n=1 Tax=Tothia fuscella TaxID=1048955 RepID=A0A9P4NJL6_9PEZI|nr:snare protein syntaxin-like protein 18/UFE1 [Tothia fuscella]
MDITFQFSDCLSRNGAHRLEPFIFDISAIDKFLQEAYQINSRITELTIYLRTIRSSYLTLQPHRTRNKRNVLADSTSSFAPVDKTQPLTDAQRTHIDAQTRQVLTTISTAIKQLSEAARASSDLDSSLSQQKRHKEGLGLLGRWAAGGGIKEKSPAELEEEAASETIRMHRDGVLWFLQRRLEAAGEMQRSMVEIRVNREVERSRSVLYKARGTSAMGMIDGLGQGGSNNLGGEQAWKGSSTMSGMDIEQDQQQRDMLESMLSPEQVQMFEKEQQDMLKHYSDELNKIRTAESSLMEISSLQSELAQNLEMQSENISQLVADSFNTAENVQQGNQQLKKAAERGSTAQMVFYATCGLCTFLTLWDLIF